MSNREFDMFITDLFSEYADMKIYPQLIKQLKDNYNTVRI